MFDPVRENLTATVLTVNCTAAVMGKVLSQMVPLSLWFLFAFQIPDLAHIAVVRG